MNSRTHLKVVLSAPLSQSARTLWGSLRLAELEWSVLSGLFQLGVGNNTL